MQEEKWLQDRRPGSHKNEINNRKPHVTVMVYGDDFLAPFSPHLGKKKKRKEKAEIGKTFFKLTLWVVRPRCWWVQELWMWKNERKRNEKLTVLEKVVAGAAPPSCPNSSSATLTVWIISLPGVTQSSHWTEPATINKNIFCFMRSRPSLSAGGRLPLHSGRHIRGPLTAQSSAVWVQLM